MSAGQALTTTPAGAVATADLEALAARINEEHEQCANAMRAGLHHALEAGRLLLQAKGRLPHGAWLPWLGENCSVPVRTAQMYMQLARDLPAQLEGEKSATVAHLSVREAVALVARAEDEVTAVDRTSVAPQVPRWYLLGQPFETRQEVCRAWWDQRARYTLLLDAQGLQAAEIAQTLGVSLEQVQRILRPRVPRRFHNFLNGAANEAGECMFSGDVAPVYATLVDELILSLVEMEYRWAALAAEVEKRDLRPHLEALAHHYRRRRMELQSGEEWATFWGNARFYPDFDDVSCPLWSCALTDARVAVGIEPDIGEDLLHLWARMRWQPDEAPS